MGEQQKKSEVSNLNQDSKVEVRNNLIKNVKKRNNRAIALSALAISASLTGAGISYKLMKDGNPLRSLGLISISSIVLTLDAVGIYSTKKRNDFDKKRSSKIGHELLNSLMSQYDQAFIAEAQNITENIYGDLENNDFNTYKPYEEAIELLKMKKELLEDLAYKIEDYNLTSIDPKLVENLNNQQEIISEDVSRLLKLK